MIKPFKTWKEILIVLLIFYIPFFSAIFFNFFNGKLYESPIGGCCISMEGVVVTSYALFTIWILLPIFLIYLSYMLYKKSRIWRLLLPIFAIAFGAFIFVYGGYDDSPGAQLLGAIIVASGILGIIKNRTRI